MEQDDLFGKKREPAKREGERLRDKGMAQSLAHAEDEHEEWRKKALRFLYHYSIKAKGSFSGEMVRIASKDDVPKPPSLRAWGSIMKTGAKNGWIRQVGYTKVLNPRAHRANAAIWEGCL
jgi:hypothetical protein